MKTIFLVLFSTHLMLGFGYNYESNFDRLERKVDRLTQKVNELIDLIYRSSIEQPIQPQLTITSIDNFFGKIILSNGKEYSYSSSENIEHWLEGQMVILEKGRKKDHVKMVNAVTGDFIEAKKWF